MQFSLWSVSFYFFTIVLISRFKHSTCDTAFESIENKNKLSMCCGPNKFVHGITSEDNNGRQEILICQDIISDVHYVFKELEITTPGNIEGITIETQRIITNFSLTESLEDVTMSSNTMDDYQNEDEEGLVKFMETGFPKCSFPLKTIRNDKDIWFQVRGDKTGGVNVEIGLRWPFNPVWIKLPSNTYCVNKIQREGNATSLPLLSTNYSEKETFDNLLLILCESKVEDYNVYIISRYFVGVSNMISAILFGMLVIIYIILRKTHNVVGWLIFALSLESTLYFGLSGILTIIDAQWMDVQSTNLCIFWYTLTRYLQTLLTFTNGLTNFHMMLTFLKMTIRIKSVDRSLRKLKFYIIAILLLPGILVFTDQICSRNFPGSKFVKNVHRFGHGRCSPPETIFFDQILGVLVIIILIIVVSCGIIILYLRTSTTRLKTQTATDQFLETANLFLKLLLASGAPLLIKFLTFLYFGHDEPLKWQLTAIFCVTEVLPAIYLFFIFGIPKSNRQKLLLILQRKPINSTAASVAMENSRVSLSAIPTLTKSNATLQQSTPTENTTRC